MHLSQIHDQLSKSKTVLQGLESSGAEWLELYKQEQCQVLEMIAYKAGFSLDAYDKTYDKKMPSVEEAISYAIGGGSWKPRGFVIAGPRGVGKTCLLSAALKDRSARLLGGDKSNQPAYSAVAQLVRETRYLDHYSLTDTIREHMFSEGEPEFTMEEVEECGLLIIDDLGAANNWPHFVTGLEQIMKRRVAEHRTTWIATNYYAEDFKKMPGWERIVSVLGDSNHFTYVEANGKSRRT